MNWISKADRRWEQRTTEGRKAKDRIHLREERIQLNSRDLKGESEPISQGQGTPRKAENLLIPIASSRAKAIYDPSPSHSVLGCSGHSRPVSPLLFQLSFSVSPPTVARPASLPLPLRVPGQGLVCGAGCWLPEGLSDPAPLPPQYLLGHWFLSRLLPQIFILDLLLPSDLVDALQTVVEECLDLLLHRLCCWKAEKQRIKFIGARN